MRWPRNLSNLHCFALYYIRPVKYQEQLCRFPLLKTFLSKWFIHSLIKGSGGSLKFGGKGWSVILGTSTFVDVDAGDILGVRQPKHGSRQELGQPALCLGHVPPPARIKTGSPKMLSVYTETPSVPHFFCVEDLCNLTVMNIQFLGCVGVLIWGSWVFLNYGFWKIFWKKNHDSLGT